MSARDKPDRRAMIVEASIRIIATRGVRALSHGSVDSELGLPPGSTSYYYRTRHSLLEAIVLGITTRSRDEFEASGLEATAATTPRDAARAVAGWLHELVVHRRDHVVARYALVIELAHDPRLHELLAGSLFSRDRAAQLFGASGTRDPAAAAAGFVSVVEGVVFDHLLAASSLDRAGSRDDQIERLARPLEAFLVGTASLDHPSG